jgi:hypothetical protein
MLVSSESEAGTNAAAPTPCNARARTRTHGDGERPPSTDETPNRARPARNNLRRPMQVRGTSAEEQETAKGEDIAV